MMGAEIYRGTVYHYHDCQFMAACPGHPIEVWLKHGTYEAYWPGDRDAGKPPVLAIDCGLFDSISGLIQAKRDG